MNKKSVFAVLSAVSLVALSYAEDEALDGPEAAASIVEADPSGHVKAANMSTETTVSAESDNTTPGDIEEEPSLDESDEDTTPSGEDFFVVEPPSDLSAPDAPDRGEEGEAAKS